MSVLADHGFFSEPLAITPGGPNLSVYDLNGQEYYVKTNHRSCHPNIPLGSTISCEIFIGLKSEQSQQSAYRYPQADTTQLGHTHPNMTGLSFSIPHTTLYPKNS